MFSSFYLPKKPSAELPGPVFAPAPAPAAPLQAKAAEHGGVLPWVFGFRRQRMR